MESGSHGSTSGDEVRLSVKADQAAHQHASGNSSDKRTFLGVLGVVFALTVGLGAGFGIGYSARGANSNSSQITPLPTTSPVPGEIKLVSIVDAKPEFDSVIRSSADLIASARVLAQREEQFAHEAGVWLPETGEVLFTSNRLPLPGGSERTEPFVVSLSTGVVRSLPLDHSLSLNPNGGTATGNGHAVMCSQGSGEITGQIALWEFTSADSVADGEVTVTPLATDYPCDAHPSGRCPFNSPNDVTITPDSRGAFFTDPTYGVLQGLVATETQPELNPGVYYVDLEEGEVTRMFENCCFGLQPNGIQLSPDGSVLYVSDTHNNHAVYSLSVEYHGQGPPTLRTPTFFYEPGFGLAPDGIKVDSAGNLYLGCTDGVHVVSPAGALLGKIQVQGGVANLVFAGDDYSTLVMLNEQRIIAVDLLASGLPRNEAADEPA